MRIYSLYTQTGSFAGMGTSIAWARKNASAEADKRGCSMDIYVRCGNGDDFVATICPTVYRGKFAKLAHAEGITGCYIDASGKPLASQDNVSDEDARCYSINLTEVTRRHARWSQGRA